MTDLFYLSHNFDLKLFSIFILLIITLIAGYIPFHRHLRSNKNHELPLMTGFAQGVFIGAGLIHMLGDASGQFIQEGYLYPWAFLIAGLVFLCLFIFEQLSEISSMALLGTLMLSIHSLLEGSALGLSDNLLMTSLILIAILAHKWAASFALSIEINKSPYLLSSRIFLFLIFALMTPLGILIGTEIHQSLNTNHTSFLEPCFNSMAAGTFIYLGISHGLHQSQKSKKTHQPQAIKTNFGYLSFILLGFGIMALVAIWA